MFRGLRLLGGRIWGKQKLCPVAIDSISTLDSPVLGSSGLQNSRGSEGKYASLLETPVILQGILLERSCVGEAFKSDRGSGLVSVTESPCSFTLLFLLRV